MKVEIKCQNCEKLFTTNYKHRDKKFCNRTCYFEFAKKNNLLGREKDDKVRENRKCIQCGNIFNERIKHDRKLCSEECRNQWNSTESNKKNRIEKSQNSLTEKYGEKSIFSLDNFKKNRKKIYLEKFGVESPMHLKENVNKLKETIRKKHLNLLLPKLFENNIELLSEYDKNKNGNTSQPYIFKCTSCNNIFSSTLLGSGKVPICRKCNPITKNSKLEQLIKDFLNEKNIYHITSDRKLLDGKEIDIYIPNLKIGIEVNGNYFHSENGGDKTKYYHITKTILSNEQGIDLLQFYEDEILFKKDIILSKLSSKLNLNTKIHARKCVIREISKKESTEFLNQNHLQGNSIDNIRFGLFLHNDLVSVMTFGKKRKSLGKTNNNFNEYELVRFSNKKFINVIGGFSKMLKYFIKNYNPSKIETFADIRWSGVNPIKTVYFKNGFKFIGKTPPNYWYIKNDKYSNRYHRFVFRKDVLVKEGYDKNLTEWEIMKIKGYDRIWDCGSLKFEYTNFNFD